MIRNKLFLMLLFLGICSIARGQTSQYWFDSNYGGVVSKRSSPIVMQRSLPSMASVYVLPFL